MAGNIADATSQSEHRSPYCPALVAQGIERRTPKPGVAGSNPAGGTPESLASRPMVSIVLARGGWLGG
jgi:hypothetical protein